MGAIVLIMMLIALSSASEGGRLDDDRDVADDPQLCGDRCVRDRRG